MLSIGEEWSCISLMKRCFQRIQQKAGMSSKPAFGSISTGMPCHGLFRLIFLRYDVFSNQLLIMFRDIGHDVPQGQKHPRLPMNA